MIYIYQQGKIEEKKGTVYEADLRMNLLLNVCIMIGFKKLDIFWDIFSCLCIRAIFQS